MISKCRNVLEFSSNFLRISVININTSDQVHKLIYALPSIGNKVSVFYSLYLKKQIFNMELATKNVS